MDEKLNILSETMDRIFGKNGKKEPDATIEDPSELAKQVNTYIEKLESDLAEVTCKYLFFEKSWLLINDSNIIY